MKEELKIKPSEELAYWTGVVQTDGCLYKDKYSWKIIIDVANKSLNMIQKFEEISRSLFKLDKKIVKRVTREIWRYHVTVTTLLHIFQKLDIKFGDPPRPPKWCKSSLSLFGAYLAGVIDGDGSIRTMNMKKYPECVIKISSGCKQKELANNIKALLNCAVRITKQEDTNIIRGNEFFGRWYDLEFYVSSKNYELIEKLLIPHLTIPHKINKLNSFIQYRFKMGSSSSLVY